MLRKDKEITDISDIERIIKKATYCRIGLVDNDEPYIIPICFGYEGNALYFHGASEGRKVELIRKNNKICFEIDTDVELTKAEEPCGWAMRYRSVIGVGRAHFLEGDEEKSRGLGVIVRHYTEGNFTFPKVKLDKIVVVRVDIESITGRKSGY